MVSALERQASIVFVCPVLQPNGRFRKRRLSSDRFSAAQAGHVGGYGPDY